MGKLYKGFILNIKGTVLLDLEELTSHYILFINKLDFTNIVVSTFFSTNLSIPRSKNNVKYTLYMLSQNYSTWCILKRAMAWIIKLNNTLQGKQAEKVLTTHEVKEAELALIRHVQKQHFSKEISHLVKNKTVPGVSELRKLSPQLNDSGILMVYGIAPTLAYSHCISALSHPPEFIALHILASSHILKQFPSIHSIICFFHINESHKQALHSYFSHLYHRL